MLFMCNDKYFGDSESITLKMASFTKNKFYPIDKNASF